MQFAVSSPRQTPTPDSIERVERPCTVQTGIWIEEHGWLHRLFKSPDNTSPRFRFPDLLGACVSLTLGNTQTHHRRVQYLATQLPLPDPRREATTQAERAQAERRRQLVELLAEIEKRVNNENARPRKRYVSPATREVVYAQYYDQLRRKIEERGTRDFPEYRGRKLYGELTMNLHIDARGRVVDVEMVQSSGNARLDQRAIAIVQAASPFGYFSAEMLKGAEILVITSRFRFTRDEGLATTLAAQPNP